MKQKPTQKYPESTRDDVMEVGVRQHLPHTYFYDVFMDEQNIPIYRGIGVYDVRELPLAPWKRMGGQGTFIELDGQAGYFGMYVVEVPAGGVLNPERHIYEETFWVVEGHGSTEIWREGSSKKQTFEWQPSSLFAVPLNVWHRLVNATSSPALVVVTTSAPNVMELFPTRSSIFDNPCEFLDRYDEREDYFKPRDELEGTERTRAYLHTNLLPDVADCHVPRINARAPGMGHFNLRKMAGNDFLTNGIYEYPSGRYSTGHSHLAGRVLVCLRGKGYSLNWPLKLGKRPWEEGKGHLVNRQDYIPGGMVTAAAGGGDWFHQHFSTAKDSLRTMRLGTNGRYLVEEEGDEIELPGGILYLGPGRHEIKYPEEDPQVRKDYKEALKKEGAKFTMPESVYQ